MFGEWGLGYKYNIIIMDNAKEGAENFTKLIKNVLIEAMKIVDDNVRYEWHRDEFCGTNCDCKEPEFLDMDFEDIAEMLLNKDEDE